MPLLDRPTQAAFAFGGLMGDRIAANQRHWLLAAPTANPAMLTMLRDRDEKLDDRGQPAADGRLASDRLIVWSGEYAGKYLISAVQGFRLTRDQHLLAELREFVARLIGFQAPDGYLGPFEQQQRMTGQNFWHDALWDLWGQYHCLLGLYYWFKETGDTAALDACKRSANRFCATFLGNTFLETDLAAWEFSREGGPVIAARLRLVPDRTANGGPDWARGSIDGHHHPNEARWAWDGPTLVFFAQNGAPSTRFDEIPRDRVWKGAFLFDASITHVLRRVYAPAPAQNQAAAHILALLHRETGDPNYLQLLRKFEAAWKAVGGNYVDGFQGTESFFENPSARRWESLPSVQAIAELYLLTSDEKYRRAIQRVWASIRERDRHNTGGFSSREMATGNPYDPRPIETCATVAWIALTVDMLRLTADSAVADELELSTWNAALGAQSPDGRWWTYDTPMGGVPTAGLGAVDLPVPLGGRPPAMLGERRPARYDLHFQDTSTRGTSHLSCCAANGPRALGALCEWAVMIADDGGITLNYYGPSAFTVRAPSGRDVSLVQETDYPVGGRIVLSIVPSSAVESFRLRLRIPAWSGKTVVRLNGTDQSVKAGTYLTLDRAWTPGDTIELLLDMSPRFLIGGLPPPGADAYGGSTVDMVSIYHGPLLLAYDRRLNTFDPMRVPPLLRSGLPSPVVWPPGTPGPMLPLQFSSVRGPVTLCDFASAGFDFPQPPLQRPNPYRGWRFGRGDGSVIAGHIHLERDGTISGHSHPNEARWGFEGDVLVFYAQDRRPSTRFTWVSLKDGRQELRGVFLFDRRILHVLSEDDTSDWTRLWQFGRADGSVIAERLLLQVDGRIVGHDHPNEFRWDTGGGTLVFYAQDGRPSTRFSWVSRENGQRVLRGAFLFDRSITHVLEELDASVSDKVWEFSRESGALIAGNVRLLPGGVMSGHSHPNEARWGFEGDALVFYSAQGRASTRFTSLRMQHGRPVWRGRFEFDPSLTHVLSERDLDLTKKLWRFVRKRPEGPQGAIDLRLLDDTEIEGADHPNESWWGVDGGALVFRGRSGAVSTRFDELRVGSADDVFDFRGVPDVEKRTIRSGQVSPEIRHELRESNIDLGWVAGSRYVSWIPISEASLGFQVPRARFAPTVMENRLMIVTADGRVFAREVGGSAIGASLELGGPAVAANPWDTWVVTIGHRILVVVNDGNVFAHDVTGNTISLASHLTGPPVASNDQDKWVVTMDNRVLVIVKDGRVFAHDISHRSIGGAIQLVGPPVAANPVDKWVVTMGSRVLVIVNNGAVFAHDIVGNTIGTAVRLSGPPVATNPGDRWVLTMGSRVVVIVNDGRVFAHDVTGSAVAAAVQLA